MSRERSHDGAEAYGVLGDTSTPTVPRDSAAGAHSAAPPRLPVLPESVWTDRDALKHVRRAAAARMVSPDVLLLVVLARLASMLDPRLVLDVGRGPAQLCTYVAVVGPSGVGKSTGVRAAHDLLPAPKRLADPDAHGHLPFLDGMPIGSGEGLAECYMGRRRPDGGGPPTRMQVRGRVLVVVDEGARLTALGERRGATTADTLRSAWAGETIGSRGAQEDTTRVVAARSYTLGVVTGWQMGTAQALVTATDAGDAQRFLWCAAAHPGVSEHDVPDWPGPLPDPWDAGLPADWQAGAHTISYPEHIRTALRAEHAAVQRGDLVRQPGDEHAPLHRARLAALLACLDGRTRVTADDWTLGETLWRSSCAVRDAVAEHGRQQAARERDERDDARVTLAERTAAVVDVAPTRVQRIAERLAGYVHDDGALTRSEARRRLRSGERHLYAAAVTVAEVRGWIAAGDHGLTPGTEHP